MNVAAKKSHNFSQVDSLLSRHWRDFETLFDRLA